MPPLRAGLGLEGLRILSPLSPDRKTLAPCPEPGSFFPPAEGDGQEEVVGQARGSGVPRDQVAISRPLQEGCGRAL